MIKLNRTDGIEILINTEHIKDVFSFGEGAKVVFVNQEDVFVNNSLSEIQDMIIAHKHGRRVEEESLEESESSS